MPVAPVPVLAVAEAAAPAEPDDAAVTEPDVERLYAALPDGFLNTELELAHAQRTVAALDLPAAQARYEQVKSNVEAGNGPAITQLKAIHAQHRERFGQVQTLQAATEEARAAARQLGHNAGERAGMETQLGRLGALSGRRKTDLREQIADLQAHDKELEDRIIAARDRVAPFRAQLGPPEQQQRLLDAAQQHRDNLPQLRAQAAQRDTEAVTRAAGAIERLRAAGDEADQRWHALDAEKQSRADDPDPSADEQRTAAYEAALRQQEENDHTIDYAARDWQPPTTPAFDIER